MESYAIAGKQLIPAFDRTLGWERAEKDAHGFIFSRHEGAAQTYIVNVTRYNQPRPEAILRSIEERSGRSEATLEQLLRSAC